LPDVTIRPTSKFIQAATVALLVVAIGANIAYRSAGAPPDYVWAPLLLFLLLLWPAARWLRVRFTRAVLSGDRLRYESGIMSRSIRTLQLSKVQDVRVDQSLSQRIFDVGDVSIETAGETSRLTIPNVDHPRKVADEIMNAAQKGPAAQ